MASLDGLSVLLVEDEYLIALDAEQILKDLGAQSIEFASNLNRAKKHAEDGSYDLAILDLNLNGELSYPVAAILRGRGVPVVFASGYELKGRHNDDEQEDISVSKPYTAEGLRKALVAALNAAAAPPQQRS